MILFVVYANTSDIRNQMDLFSGSVVVELGSIRGWDLVLGQ